MFHYLSTILLLVQPRMSKASSTHSSQAHGPSKLTKAQTMLDLTCIRETYSWSLPAFDGFKHHIHHQSSSLVEVKFIMFFYHSFSFIVLYDLIGGKKIRTTKFLCLYPPSSLTKMLSKRREYESKRSVGSFLSAIKYPILPQPRMYILTDWDQRRKFSPFSRHLPQTADLSDACLQLASFYFAQEPTALSLRSSVIERVIRVLSPRYPFCPLTRLMEYYMQKTYYKTASPISNNCKAIALLAGQTTEVAMLAFEYGKNLGLAFQLIDDVLDFTGYSNSSNIICNGGVSSVACNS
ncbi:hypothetical protein K2173_006572 [Erythroxylum novogranatense]|uniref:Uncharacterized protein n=1 Tax=Erythroxylum novogranatense TaxID=1862640 RepID=A0AAV8T6X4_9ROSI|nr:hypothetical protein K2173_006572 [Erythroxylum novogranatense]